MVTDYELINIDPEDIEDLLVKVEASFDMKFADKELVHLATFGQLCDYISNKIQHANSNDCTSQQAFYKLRNAISSTFQMDTRTLSPNVLLATIFPKQNRRSNIKKLETHLGLQLDILRAPHWIRGTLIILMLVSFVIIFIKWQIGVLGFVFFISALLLAAKTGRVLDLQTLGQVAEKMTREHYLKSRRNSNTFNKTEIEKVLTDWFSIELDINKNKLTRDTKF